MSEHESDTSGLPPKDASAPTTEPQGVEFLTDTQINYLREGILEGETEPDLLERLREHFAKTLWQTPCINGLDREEIELIARRLHILPEEIPSLKPNEVFRQLDELAVELRTDIDRLYHPDKIPSVDVLRRIRREKLNRTQGEIAEHLAEANELSQSSYVTRISHWESGNRIISEEDRERLTTIYRDIYKEDHDPYQIRDERDWTAQDDSKFDKSVPETQRGNQR